MNAAEHIDAASRYAQRADDAHAQRRLGHMKGDPAWADQLTALAVMHATVATAMLANRDLAETSYLPGASS